MVARGVAWGRLVAALMVAAVLAAVLVAALAGPARADFTVDTCAGNPAAPWRDGVGVPGFPGVGDQCATDEGFAFWFATLSPNQYVGAGLVAPPGEAMTHVTLTYRTVASTGGQAKVEFGYNGVPLVDPVMGNGQGASLDVALPDASDFFVRAFCPSTQSCGFTNAGNVNIGVLDLTMHDTGVPSVSATGGDLSSSGIYQGVQSLVYNASDAGSGVARVTATLGTTVLASAQSTCQSFSLTPCPPSVSGTLAVNTALLPDGTYPVILTAYDASGDPTAVQVSHVTLRNHSRTVSVPAPRRRKGAVRTKIQIGWRWNGPRTTLTRLAFSKLARSATVTVSCQGKGCPFRTRRSTARQVKRLTRTVRGAKFRVGERLELTVSQPHLRAERGEVRFRRGRVPVIRRR